MCRAAGLRLAALDVLSFLLIHFARAHDDDQPRSLNLHFLARQTLETRGLEPLAYALQRHRSPN
jgi:hypothetical protein